MNQYLAFALIVWIVFCGLAAFMGVEHYREWRKRERFERQLRTKRWGNSNG
jgi:hypothetical protein